MKKMKRLGVLILALALAWSLTACGGSRSSGTSVLPALSGGSGASADWIVFWRSAASGRGCAERTR